MGLRRGTRFAAMVIAAFGVWLLASAPARAADPVVNPGSNFNATVTGGEIKIGTSLDPIDVGAMSPSPRLRNITVNPDGSFSAAAADFVFPQLTLAVDSPVGAVDIFVQIRAASPVTGTIVPATGEVTRTWVQAWSYDGRDEPPTVVEPASDPSWTWEVYDGTALGGAVLASNATPAIDVNWGSGSPEPSVGNDTFSVRVTRTLVLPAGTYTVIGGSDDGIRVTVDGVRLIDRWSDRSYGTNSVPVTLTAGAHDVVVEFYENGGQARLTLQILDAGGTDVSR